jgi:hypothetical protein
MERCASGLASWVVRDPWKAVRHTSAPAPSKAAFPSERTGAAMLGSRRER